jgi:hypothetical protein
MASSMGLRSWRWIFSIRASSRLFPSESESMTTTGTSSRSGHAGGPQAPLAGYEAEPVALFSADQQRLDNPFSAMDSARRCSLSSSKCLRAGRVGFDLVDIAVEEFFLAAAGQILGQQGADAPRPSTLFDAHCFTPSYQFVAQFLIRLGSGTVAVILKDRFAVAGTFAEPDIAWG